MALVNPNIALGARPVELANPLAQYGQIAQLQAAQNQNALAQYQLGAAKRGEETQNVLAKAYAQSVDPSTGKIDYNKLTSLVASGGGGAQLPSIEKTRRETETAALTQQKTQTELLDTKLKQARGFLDTIDPTDPTAPAKYLAWHEANHRDPIIGSALAERGVSAEQARRSIEDAIAKGPQALAQMINQSKLGTEKFMEMNKPVTSVGPTGIVQTPGLGGGAATIVPGTEAAFQRKPTLMTPEEEAQKMRIAAAGRAVTNVQLPPQEKAEQAERGKMLTTEYSDISKAAKLAAKTLPSIDTNLNILNSGFKTGFGTEAIAAGAKVLGALGVPDAEKLATNAQTFLGSASQAVLQKQLEQKGPQTESDALRIQQTGAQLGNTVQANQFMLSTAKAQLKRDMDQRNFYDNWWKNNKTYDGAESAWYAGEGGKSLFDRPELKQYATPGAVNQIPTTRAPTPARAPAAAPNIDALLNKYK